MDGVKYYLIGVIDVMVCKRITTRGCKVSEYNQASRADQHIEKNICRYVE